MSRITALAALLFCSLGLGAQQRQPASVQLPPPVHVVVDVGLRTTGLYHRETCAWLKGVVTPLKFKLEQAKQRHFQPHCACVHGFDEVPPCSTVPLLQASSTPAPVATPLKAEPVEA